MSLWVHIGGMEAVYDGERPLGAPDSTRVLFLPFSHADVCGKDVVRSGGIDLIFFPEGACDFRRETRAQLTQGAKPWYDFLSTSSPLWREKQFQYQGECQNVSTLDCSSRGDSARESNFMPPTHVKAVPTSFQLMKTWILHLGFFGSPSY